MEIYLLCQRHESFCTHFGHHICLKTQLEIQLENIHICFNCSLNWNSWRSNNCFWIVNFCIVRRQTNSYLALKLKLVSRPIYCWCFIWNGLYYVNILNFVLLDSKLIYIWCFKWNDIYWIFCLSCCIVRKQTPTPPICILGTSHACSNNDSKKWIRIRRYKSYKAGICSFL